MLVLRGYLSRLNGFCCFVFDIVSALLLGSGQGLVRGEFGAERLGDDSNWTFLKTPLSDGLGLKASALSGTMVDDGLRILVSLSLRGCNSRARPGEGALAICGPDPPGKPFGRGEDG